MDNHLNCLQNLGRSSLQNDRAEVAIKYFDWTQKLYQSAAVPVNTEISEEDHNWMTNRNAETKNYHCYRAPVTYELTQLASHSGSSTATEALQQINGLSYANASTVSAETLCTIWNGKIGDTTDCETQAISNDVDFNANDETEIQSYWDYREPVTDEHTQTSLASHMESFTAMQTASQQSNANDETEIQSYWDYREPVTDEHTQTSLASHMESFTAMETASQQNNGFSNVNSTSIFAGTSMDFTETATTLDSSHLSSRNAVNPNGRKYTRKRLSRQEEWKSHIAKQARATGQTGVTRDGNPIEQRKIGPACCCRFRCASKISTDDRRSLFDEYWKIGSRSRQWDYIDKLIVSKEPNERKVEEINVRRERKITREYYLPVSSTKMKVCRTMFLNTFAESQQILETIRNRKKDPSDSFIEECKQGKHSNRPKKVKQVAIDSVHEHIANFERVESHFCRKSTTREYLDDTLNIAEMYSMYIKWMANQQRTDTVSSYRYRHIFNTEYNLFFHKPKKDFCDECAAWQSLDKDERESELETHEHHLKTKEIARSWMAADEKEATQNAAICCASFDLQQVLNVPFFKISSAYYKRAVAIYNFTVYDMSTKQGYCYVWNETIAKRGANEISSCLWKFIVDRVEEGKTEFRFYSDNCGGQNRNQIVYSMYIKAAKEFGVKIVHSYLVKGHTQSSGDSMHSAIEKASEVRNLFTQAEWINVMENCTRDALKYKISEITNEDVFDFAALSDKKKWRKVKVSLIRAITVRPMENIEVIYDYEKMNIKSLEIGIEDVAISKCYDTNLPLDAAKKKDLQYYLDNKLIPQKYLDYYKNLMK